MQGWPLKKVGTEGGFECWSPIYSSHPNNVLSATIRSTQSKALGADLRFTVLTLTTFIISYNKVNTVGGFECWSPIYRTHLLISYNKVNTVGGFECWSPIYSLKVSTTNRLSKIICELLFTYRFPACHKPNKVGVNKAVPLFLPFQNRCSVREWNSLTCNKPNKVGVNIAVPLFSPFQKRYPVREWNCLKCNKPNKNGVNVAVPL